MSRLLLLAVVLFLALGLQLGLLAGSSLSRGSVEGSWKVLLMGECDMEIISPPSQAQRTAVLFCPGMDATRLWPWPIQQPWLEHEGQK